MIRFYVEETMYMKDNMEGRPLHFILAVGHATGYPEVCSALSGLLYTVAAWVGEKRKDEGADEGLWQSYIEKGKGCILMPKTPETDLVARLVVTEAKLLANALPGAICFQEGDPGPVDLGAFGGADPAPVIARSAATRQSALPPAVDLRAFDGGEAGESAEAEVCPGGAERGEAGGSDPSVSTGDADSLRPALPHLPFPGLLAQRPANGAAAEIAPRLDLPQAAAERNSLSQREPSADPDPDPAALAAAERRARASEFAAARCGEWLAEAEALRGRCPDFDLETMARDRVFTLLLAGGEPMERAYRAADADAIALRAAAEARRSLSEHIRARGARPVEAGCASQPAFDVRDDPARLSDGQVRDVLARLDRRERVSFG